MSNAVIVTTISEDHSLGFAALQEFSIAKIVEWIGDDGPHKDTWQFTNHAVGDLTTITGINVEARAVCYFIGRTADYRVG